ncbi:M20 family metallopeptidase [Confluentibacter flavum]|uniref:Probable succinyl-diaminopimelate desuccinylase n=1 Tax=Confluentibacter flavum TaxID=1909700 RepID=A0A2N3HHH9_9FLAO|nr:M20 family metallopeptidase [Confluentibacter flavum]PKQ44425.1 hypothetical protein CSW08_13520 [Confluentibacter flavum]
MDVVSLTQEFIKFNTVNPPGNEEGLARYIGSILVKHGFKVEYQKYAKHRLNLVATKGLSKESPPIVLSGHLDVVPLGAEKWSVNPFEGEIKNDKLYGRGSTDMKAGLAAIIIAAIDSFAEEPPIGGVKVVFTADEELGCKGAKYLFDSGYDIGAACAIIIGEPTSNVPYIAHKGGLYLNAKTIGRTAHSSMPELGDNAIYKAASAICQIENLKFDVENDDTLGFPTINVGVVKGGLNLNSVPDKAEFTIDIRSTTKLSNKIALQQLSNILGNQVILEKLVDLNAVSTSVNHPFIQLISDICAIDYKSGSIKKSVPYLTDASVLTPWLGNAPTIILGPGEPEMAHKIDEYCYISKIREALVLYKEIIKKNGKKRL